MQPALIIVSNRLPVSVKKENGKLEFYQSVGGLSNALSSYVNDSRNKWIGWPGIPSDELTEKDRHQIADELQKHNCYPVFLSKKQIDDFYNGYSNSVLWPVFHDGELGKAATGSEQERLWKAYQKVNAVYAESVLALSDGGDTIWIHDYQLFVLPALLRQERPYDKIGLFLHIPFPDVKQMKKIHDSEALIAGMLGADLVGMHTEGYVQNFLENVQHYDSGITARHKVILQDRVVRVTQFPIGIDYAKYEKARKSRAVSREFTKLRLKYAGLKVILTVDRLDPAKGLVERATAYQTLLRENPKLRNKVLLVMVVVPSRTDIAEYQQLKQKLEKIIRDTNKEFAIIGWKPVEYIPNAIPFEQLTALYRRANVAFITPLRDGMNLVAKEYLASKPYQRGVLVLSRGAGAAEELKGAILVDPKKPATLVNGLLKALAMPKADFTKRVKRMQNQLSTKNVHVWAKSFTKSLGQDIRIPANRTHSLQKTTEQVVIKAYSQAEKRLLLIDYDGTMVPFAPKPEDAKPSQNLLHVLKKLAENPKNTVVIISGRGRDSLEHFFKHTPVNLVAEHGIYTKPTSRKTWKVTPNMAAENWQADILPILEKYAMKAPGTYVEQKDSTLVWHYRNADPYYAHKYMVILKRVLRPYAKKFNLQIAQGNKILEIRVAGVNKGTSAVSWYTETNADFALCFGDDYTDEDMFMAMPPTVHTVRVGRGRTAARYRLKNSDAVMDFLEQLIKN